MKTTLKPLFFSVKLKKTEDMNKKEIQELILINFKIFLVIHLFLSNISWGQVTISSEDFENTLSTFTVTTGAAVYHSGNSVAGDRPASSPFSVSNTYSIGATNTTLGLTSNSIVTTGYSSISMTMRVAAFSIGSTANGVDATDIVTVEVSPDGGTTYYSTVRVKGSSGSNAYWTYAGGTGNASTAYDGDVTPVDFQPTTAGSQTTNGFSTITVSSLPAVASLKVRITMVTNAASERWVLDNFVLTGTSSCTAASTQASSFSTNTVTSSSMNVAFTRGNGDGGVLVVARASGAVDTDPTSGTAYTASSTFGSGTQIGTGNYVVYNGTAGGVSSASGNIPISGLTSSTTYHFAIYEYNSSGTCFNVTELTGNQATSAVVCTAPSTQASSIGFSGVTSTGTTVSWTRGDGTAGVIVVVHSGGAVDSDPVNNTVYSASATMGSGTQIGTGNYIVYQGTGTSVAVTGLSAGISYYYAIYEYNTTDICFNLTELTGNQATLGSSASNYFRSLPGTGVWNTAGNWESSADNVTWITSTLVPTSSATLITIQTGHTIAIDATASASTIVIAGSGVLTFDGVAARAFTVTGDITISSSSGVFRTQTAGAYTNTMSIAGNISNAGTFDMTNGGSTTLVCTVTFNKSGNQTITGAGTTTRFNYVVVNMGASSNILEISSSDFQAKAKFLHAAAGVNGLKVGIIKFSGSYTFANQFFLTGANYELVAAAGIWFNNPNVTFTAQNDTYEIHGLLRITSGTFNIGTGVGNSLKYWAGSVLTVEGGALNVAGRINPNVIGESITCTITGGTITVVTIGSTSSSSTYSCFHMTAGSTFVWSAGTIILQNGSSFYGGFDYCDASTTSTISGGILQIANTSSTGVNEFYIYSVNSIPNLDITTTNSPVVFLFSNISVLSDITIASGATLDTQADPLAYAYEVANPGTTSYSATAAYDISLKGNWTNNGTFTHNSKRVTFSGTAAQTISGTATTTFHDVTINNTSGDVALSVNATVNGTITMTNGDLVIATTKILTIDDTDDPGISGGSASTHIVTSGTATVQKTYTSTTAIQFPFGDGSLYRPLTLTPSSTNNTIWTVGYTPAVYSDLDIEPATGLDHVSHQEYWTCVRGGGAPSDATMELTWISTTNVLDYTALRIAHYDGTTDWDMVASTPVGNNTSGTITSNSPVSVFSPFTIGTTLAINVLPIELTSFDGEKVEKNNRLLWTTVSEMNNDYFTVEKTIDGISFEVVGVEDGAGYSNQILNYSLMDNNVREVVNYYRLKQNDFDGKSVFSDLISIDNRVNKSNREISLITNILGQEINEFYRGLVIIYYSDGTFVKMVQ